MGSVAEWQQAGLLTRRNEDGTEGPIEDLAEASRTQMYLLGRQRVNREGQRQYPHPETAQLATQIVSVRKC